MGTGAASGWQSVAGDEADDLAAGGQRHGPRYYLYRRQKTGDRLSQLAAPEGLSNERQIGTENRPGAGEFLIISGGQQHRQFGPAIARMFGQLQAAHAARHDDVGEKQIDMLVAMQDFSAEGPSVLEIT